MSTELAPPFRSGLWEPGICRWVWSVVSLGLCSYLRNEADLACASVGWKNSRFDTNAKSVEEATVLHYRNTNSKNIPNGTRDILGGLDPRPSTLVSKQLRASSCYLTVATPPLPASCHVWSEVCNSESCRYHQDFSAFLLLICSKCVSKRNLS